MAICIYVSVCVCLSESVYASFFLKSPLERKKNSSHKQSEAHIFYNFFCFEEFHVSIKLNEWMKIERNERTNKQTDQQQRNPTEIQKMKRKKTVTQLIHSILLYIFGSLFSAAVIETATATEIGVATVHEERQSDLNIFRCSMWKNVTVMCAAFSLFVLLLLCPFFLFSLFQDRKCPNAILLTLLFAFFFSSWKFIPHIYASFRTISMWNHV